MSPSSHLCKGHLHFLQAVCLHFKSILYYKYHMIGFVQSVYMLTAAVLLRGSYIYLDGSDAGHQGSSLSDH